MNLRNFLSSGLTETCLYMLSMSALMGYFRSRKRQKTASRLLRRYGIDKSMSFKQSFLNLDFALETSLFSFSGLFGFVTSCSGSIYPVEGMSSLGSLRLYFLVKSFVSVSWYIASLSGRWEGGFSFSWTVEPQQSTCWEGRRSVSREVQLDT